LTAAQALTRGLGGDLVAGLFGAKAEAALNVIGGCGAKRLLAVSGPDFETSRYGSDAAAAHALCAAAAASIVVAPATSRLSRALPGAAQRLSGRIDTHLVGLTAKDGKPVASRWFYRQRMVASITRGERPWLLTVDSGCFEPASCEGPAGVETVAVDLPAAAKRTTVTGIKAPAADQQTIRPDARLLFVAGAGWTKKQADGATHVPEAEGLIRDFLVATKSSLGSSKSLVDISGEGHAVISFLTHLHQVGQTGSSPRHPKGLSTCCHGEEPHVVGWRFVTERRAVNLDAGCGWAQGKADVLYVADAFAVMAKVNTLLKG
jgi:electron transfer flavoprotein alpha subunit